MYVAGLCTQVSVQAFLLSSLRSCDTNLRKESLGTRLDCCLASFFPCGRLILLVNVSFQGGHRLWLLVTRRLIQIIVCVSVCACMRGEEGYVCPCEGRGGVCVPVSGERRGVCACTRGEEGTQTAKDNDVSESMSMVGQRLSIA